jgi:hypothetical protein
MKTLIAVVTARHRTAWQNAIRDTWLKLVPTTLADVRFFMGRGEPRVFLGDEIELECDDSYLGLPEKVREIARWALKNGYDFMLKCDDDTVIRPELLLTSGYEKYPYSGKTNRHLEGFNVPVGFNWWISKECMKIVSEAELPPGDNDDEKWVAWNLHLHGIHLTHDHRYELYMGELPEQPKSRLYRPLRPPKINSVVNRETFSWTIFLEANSGNGIPMENKIKEFYHVWGRLYSHEGEPTSLPETAKN